MPSKEELERTKKIAKLKKEFLTNVVYGLKATIQLIENKTEIQKGYLIRIEDGARGLLEITEMEDDKEAIRIFSELLRLIGKKDLQKKLKTLQVFDRAIEKYAKKVEPYKNV